MEELQLQSIIVSEEERISNTIYTGRLENDVLRMRIGVMAKDHAAEKNEIIKTKDKTIVELKATNEELNIKTSDQSDKMQQMDKASRGKDDEIESLTKRVGELSEQKHQLEMNLKQTKEMHEQSTMTNSQKEERIKELESELSEVKEKLKVTIFAKEEQESWFAAYIKKAEENQERRDKQLQKNEERRDKQLQENEERRDKQLQKNEERRDTQLQENEERKYKQLQKNEERRDKQLQKHHEEFLCQIKSMDIRSKSLAVNDSKVRITDSHNVQICFEPQNGRKDDAFYRKPGFYNRNTCKLPKGNNNLPK